jgi:RNA polymerase sigma-70 factor (ECF subfamily)
MVMTQPAGQDADLPLVEALMRGEPQALGDIVRRHERWVRGVVFGMTGRNDLVDDVVQQVWTTVWRQIGTLRDPASWRAWLYKLVRRATIDAGKRRRRQQRREVTTDGELLAEAPRMDRPDQELIANEQKERLLQAIRSLPAIYREPFVLKHLEDWSYAEIGEVLSLPVDTVETRLVRARRMLREMLQGVL